MSFVLVRERRIPKDELQAMSYVRSVCESGLPRRQILKLLGSAGLLSLVPPIKMIGPVGAVPVGWLVSFVNVADKKVHKQAPIVAEVGLKNPAAEKQSARVVLEYKLPSGYSGAQAAKTVALPGGMEQIFEHSNFVARELGESTYIARATGIGEGEEQDNFRVVDG